MMKMQKDAVNPIPPVPPSLPPSPPRDMFYLSPLFSAGLWRAEEWAQLGVEMRGEEEFGGKENETLEEGQENIRKGAVGNERKEREREEGDRGSETERMRKWNYVVMETGMDLKSKTRM